MPARHAYLLRFIRAVSYLTGWFLLLLGTSVLVSAWSVAMPGGTGLH